MQVALFLRLRRNVSILVLNTFASFSLRQKTDQNPNIGKNQKLECCIKITAHKALKQIDSVNNIKNIYEKNAPLWTDLKNTKRILLGDF